MFDARPGGEPITTDVAEVELLQHFVGWEIEAERDVFDPEVVEMMDFAAAQARGLYFTYVLPFSRRRALVEATYISAAPLPAAQYEADIRDYLARKHGLVDFAVLFREAGQIPMSTRPLRPRSSPRVINIGLRGGLAKASTGYAFDAIQTFSAELAWATLAYAVRNGGPEVAAAVRALAEPLRAAAMAADDMTDATDINELPTALLLAHGRLPAATMAATRRDAWLEILGPTLDLVLGRESTDTEDPLTLS